MNRVNEISFNSSLLRELHAISFVMRLIERGGVNGDGLRRMLIHCIHADGEMEHLGVASKLNAGFLRLLQDIGRAHADGWPAGNFDRLGQESTVDIARDFL